jgi:predicted acetyltransferase
MTIEIRPPALDERRAAQHTFATALLFPPADDEAWERSRPSWEEMVSLAAWDGDRCVGHAGHFLVDTTVPGGARVATGAVSRVGVLGTHRRRGVATKLMHGLVERAVDDGLVLMSLRASEAVIYERYGFGIAGEYAEAVIDAQRARPLRHAASGGTFELLGGHEIHSIIHDVYERYAHTRPGVITRPDSFWERYYRDAVAETKSSHVVVHRDGAGAVDGFAHYDVQWNEDEGAQGGKGEIHDVVGASPSIELALWSYLFDLDLIRHWKATERPCDDIVRWSVADPRAYTIKVLDDEQWVRLVDVGSALAARTYNPASASVTIAVRDPLIPDNNATWRVSADGAAATGDPADLSVDIATVSAAYLGGTSWHTLWSRGSVVGEPDAVALADTLFASRPLPFCGSFF